MLAGPGSAGFDEQMVSILTRAGMPCCASACWTAAGSSTWLLLKVSVSVPLALRVRVKAAVPDRAGPAVRWRAERAGQAEAEHD